MKYLIITFLLLLLSVPVFAMNATLTWEAPNDDRVIGYYVYYGNNSVTDNKLDAGNKTELEIEGLTEGEIYFFGAKSYSEDGRTSVMSDVLRWKAQGNTIIEVPSQPRSIEIRFR